MADNLRIRKANFAGGIEEAWARGLDPRARCLHCQGRPAVWIRTYYQLPDFLRVFGQVQSLLYAQKHGGKLPIMETIHGPMVFVSEVYACKSCGPAAEIAAAKHPSWALVEVRKAPVQRTLIQVPG